MNIDEQVSENIRMIIKKKYGTATNLARKLRITPQALNGSVADIKKGKYPSVKKLKKIAKICDCEITDFFKLKENIDL